MTLPPEHKIGDKLFKYEGFGWESDRIAYRFYFDQRGLVVSSVHYILLYLKD